MEDVQSLNALKSDLVQWIQSLEDPGIIGVLAHLKVAFSEEEEGLVDEADRFMPVPTQLAPPSPEEELRKLVEDWIAEVEGNRD